MIPQRSLAALAGLVLSLVAAPAALAQGLVQIAFDGRMDGTLTLDGAELPVGGRVEVEVGAVRDGEERKVELDLFLAHGTSGAELGAIVGERLTRAGFDVLQPPGEPGRSRGCLFVENALFVNLRTEHGMQASVTVSEGAPRLIKLVAPRRAGAETAHLVVAAAVETPHGKGQEGLTLALPLGEEDHPAQVAERLMNLAVKQGHQSERPQPNTWRPLRTADGGTYTGFEVQITGRSDWRLEVSL